MRLRRSSSESWRRCIHCRPRGRISVSWRTPSGSTNSVSARAGTCNEKGKELGEITKRLLWLWFKNCSTTRTCLLCPCQTSIWVRKFRKVASTASRKFSVCYGSIHWPRTMANEAIRSLSWISDHMKNLMRGSRLNVARGQPSNLSKDSLQSRIKNLIPSNRQKLTRLKILSRVICSWELSPSIQTIRRKKRLTHSGETPIIWLLSCPSIGRLKEQGTKFRINCSTSWIRKTINIAASSWTENKTWKWRWMPSKHRCAQSFFTFWSTFAAISSKKSSSPPETCC